MACPRIIIPILALVYLFFTFSEAVEILVGGKENSWNTFLSNSSERTYFDEWAKDLAIFSVIVIIQVQPQKELGATSYEEELQQLQHIKANRKIQEQEDSDQVGSVRAINFISGTKGHCEKGQELLANVACDRRDVELLTGAPAVAPTPDGQGNGAIGSRKVGFAVVIGTLARLLVK